MIDPFPNCFSIPITACASAFAFSVILPIVVLRFVRSPRRAEPFVAAGIGGEASRERPVQRAVLDRLRDVLGSDRVRAGEVRDGPGDPEHLVVAARGETEPLDGRGEEPPAPVVGGAEAPQGGAAEPRVRAAA